MKSWLRRRNQHGYTFCSVSGWWSFLVSSLSLTIVGFCSIFNRCSFHTTGFRNQGDSELISNIKIVSGNPSNYRIIWFWRTAHPNNFTLPWVLSNTPAKCKVDDLSFPKVDGIFIGSYVFAAVINLSSQEPSQCAGIKCILTAESITGNR